MEIEEDLSNKKEEKDEQNEENTKENEISDKNIFLTKEKNEKEKPLSSKENSTLFPPSNEPKTNFTSIFTNNYTKDKEINPKKENEENLMTDSLGISSLFKDTNPFFNNKQDETKKNPEEKISLFESLFKNNQEGKKENETFQKNQLFNTGKNTALFSDNKTTNLFGKPLFDTNKENKKEGANPFLINNSSLFDFKPKDENKVKEENKSLFGNSISNENKSSPLNIFENTKNINQNKGESLFSNGNYMNNNIFSGNPFADKADNETNLFKNEEKNKNPVLPFEQKDKSDKNNLGIFQSNEGNTLFGNNILNGSNENKLFNDSKLDQDKEKKPTINQYTSEIFDGNEKINNKENSLFGNSTNISNNDLKQNHEGKPFFEIIKNDNDSNEKKEDDKNNDIFSGDSFENINNYKYFGNNLENNKKSLFESNNIFSGEENIKNSFKIDTSISNINNENKNNKKKEKAIFDNDKIKSLFEHKDKNKIINNNLYSKKIPEFNKDKEENDEEEIKIDNDKSIDNEDDKNSVISEEDENQILYKPNSKYILNNFYNDKDEMNKHFSKRKPISRISYSNLIKRMLHITEKNINDIDEEPNKSDNRYNEIIENYINNLEQNLLQMKNEYIYALVKKHYYKNKNMKMIILIQENIPQKRNNVKKTFNDLIGLIKDKSMDDEENQKYYYNIIVVLLTKYMNISDEDFNKAKKLYKENRLETLKNIVYIIKDNKDDKEVILNNGWVSHQNTKKINAMKLFTCVLPLAFVGAYIYNFIKS